MEETVKDKWLKALRSGKYSQTKSVLRDKVGYCCLGVLCDIVDNSGWNNVGHSWGPAEYTFHYKKDDGCYLAPSDDFYKAIGLDPSNSEILMEMNDSGISFETIAEHIEKETLVSWNEKSKLWDEDIKLENKKKINA